MSTETPLANPPWYGFNLLEYFSTDPDWMKYFPYRNDGMFQEDDFRWMANWGFNFVRLPMDYRFWTDPDDLFAIDEQAVEPIDRAIRLGEQYEIHVDLNLHRAPGFCIVDGNAGNPLVSVTPEPASFYSDQTMLDAFCYQWAYFAERYRGVPNERVSFNLVNEPVVPLPAGLSRAERVDRIRAATESDRKAYARVARAAIESIRARDPERLIISDGFSGGNSPIPELIDSGVLQSCRGYLPPELTHFRCEWAGTMDAQRAPTWPLTDEQGQIIFTRQNLVDHYRQWTQLAEQGIQIHCGECGCYKNTPHDVMLRWFSDLLDTLSQYRIGWALWNLRGPFGVLDTDRSDVAYEDWHGHKLDRALLDLLLAEKENTGQRAGGNAERSP